MASYRLSVSIVGRSAGRSVTAAAAYRSGSVTRCARYRETHDYRAKSGVLHAEILAPETAPDWMRDRARLRNAAEAAERRRDARLAREVLLSLPHELDPAQRLDLVRDFVAAEFVALGMVADVAIHAPARDGDERNHHAHVLLTLREITPEGFGRKVRAWDRVDLLHRWREAWARAQNRKLEELGLDARVDHRSLARRGLQRLPELHMGPAATALHRRGRDSRIAAENARRRAWSEARERLRAEHARAVNQLRQLRRDVELDGLFQARRARTAGERRETRPEPGQGAPLPPLSTLRWPSPKTAAPPLPGDAIARDREEPDAPGPGGPRAGPGR